MTDYEYRWRANGSPEWSVWYPVDDGTTETFGNFSFRLEFRKKPTICKSFSQFGTPCHQEADHDGRHTYSRNDVSVTWS